MNDFRLILKKALLITCLSTAPTTYAEQVIFSEIHYNAKAGLPDFIELTNNTGTPLDMGEWFFSDGIIYTFPDFNAGDRDAHILKQFETILISPVDETALREAYPSIPPATRIFGPYAGALSNSGETLTLSDKNGIALTTIEYNDGGKWPAAADGTGHSLTRINPNRTNAGWRNWSASRLPGGTPGVTPANQEGPPTFTTQIIETTSSWKYDQNTANADLGTAWRELDYDDSSWSQGNGLFGKDFGDVFATPWTTGGRYTYYLRHEFQFNEPFSGATIDIESHLDDGAVYYLNGQEIARFNMPDGPITFGTGAVDNREWDELTEIVVAADIGNALVQGTNVFAVEVHNRTAGSNDIGFGANVTITATEPPANPLPKLVISEIHFDEEGMIDWVELHAPGNSPVPVDGLALSTSRSFLNPAALGGTVQAGGYLSFPVTLTIDENGDVDLFLIQGEAVVDAARMNRSDNEETFQSLPVGREWFGGPGDTRDAPNNPVARETGIVISEIMYDAPSDHVAAEFIELYNRGNEIIDLSGWEFTDGIRFDFPPGTSIAPGAYLVVAADAAYMRRAYGSIPVIGDWSGGLRDRGELLRLEDRLGNLVDEVDFLPEGDWPNLADGDGSSMELRHPDMNNDFASAWADSDESQKTTMQTFTYTSEFFRARWQPVTTGQELHTHLVGDAHVILENIEVTQEGQSGNLLRNPATMSPTSASSGGWVCQGTHWQSFFDGNQLNLISTGHGDNKANRAEVDFATSPIVGNTYTLSFDARWVSGKSRIIFQTLDHAFGTTFLLPIPDNLGTPGSPNSTAISTPAPTVAGLTHSPVVPKVGQPLTVSARIESAVPNTLVELVYRLDTNTGDGPWLRTPMTDDGSGLFNATVGSFTAQGNIIQFYVEASSGSVSTTQPKFGAARPAMWIVDDRDMPDQLLQHRFIISAYDLRALTTSTGGGATFDYNFPTASNQYFNATFIANESEIFYNAELRKSGSPFTRFTGPSIVNGKWKLPGDRVFRGRQRNVIDSSGTGEGTFPTPRYFDDRFGRYLLYQLGHPVNEMEFTHTVINGEPFRRRENHEPISNDFLRRNFPEGTKGTLLRVDDQWRYSDSGARTGNRSADWSYKDSENPISYHSEWLMRTREADHDYGSFIEFTRLLDENRLEPEVLERVSDTNMLALITAVRGYNADWDSITLLRGKNAYFYRPKNGNGWMFIHWDGDRIFDNSRPGFLGNLAGVGKYFGVPFVRRQYNYYLTKLLDEHTRGSVRTDAWLDAQAEAVAGTGITLPKSVYTNWFNSRESAARNFITSAVNNASFAITTSNSPTTDDTITLSGTAPPTIFNVRIPGQPEALVNWIDRTTWEITGIVLREGANSLVVEGIDHEDSVVDQRPFNITKTNNAPPIVALSTFPATLNLPVGQNLVVDAIGSFDPEGSALNFQWSVLPETGVDFTAVGSIFSATFSNPGFYLVTSQVTDADGNTSTRSVGVTTHFDYRFSGFDSLRLDGVWSPVKVENQTNSSGGAHYSFEDREGRLSLNIPYGGSSIGLPETTLPPAENYIDFGATWKYEDSGQELTATFADPMLDDSSWSSGNGFLGFNPPSGLPAPGMLTDSLTGGRVTYYFRHEFEFDADPIGAQLFIDHIVDDGVRYFLNGQAIGTVRLSPPPGGSIDSTTAAEGLPSTEENVIEENIITVADASSLLVTGTNVLAAEVHNSSAGNNDLLFGARVDIAANPILETPPDLSEAPFPWITRPLPAGDWILETELKLEKSQFGQHFAGLLVAAIQNGNSFRYGVGFQNGDQIAAFRVNPSGTPETLAGVPAMGRDQATIRLERKGNLLNFEQMVDGTFTLIHQQTLPAGTTFSVGGIFASTESDQSLEVSFGYATLVDSANDFSSWMTDKGFTDPDAEFQNTGLSNLLAYALGRDLNPAVSPAIVSDQGAITFSHRQRVVGGQITYRVEKSSDLIQWEPAGDLSPDGAPIANPDGTFTVNLLSNLSPTDTNKLYYRLRVSLL